MESKEAAYQELQLMLTAKQIELQNLTDQKSSECGNAKKREEELGMKNTKPIILFCMQKLYFNSNFSHNYQLFDIFNETGKLLTEKEEGIAKLHLMIRDLEESLGSSKEYIEGE